MRTNTKYIALAVILSMVTLGFASKNNLGIHFANLGWGDDPKEIAKEEVQKRVEEMVVEPITNSLLIKRPYLLMTKCYSRIDATYSDEDIDPALVKFYEGQTIIGNLSLNSCERANFICNYQLSLSSNEVKIRESFLDPWITLEAYQKKLETTEAVEE